MNADQPAPEMDSNEVDVDADQDAPTGTGDAEPGDVDKEPNERMRVLRMLAEGKINVSEAEELLRALEPAVERGGEAEEPDDAQNFAYAAAGQPFGPGFPFGGNQPFGPGFPFGGRGPVPPTPPMPPFRSAHPEGRQFQKLQKQLWKAGRHFPQVPMPPRPPRAPFYSLAIEIHDGETALNAHLPIALAKSGDKFLPRQVRNYLSQYEIDLTALLEDLTNSGDPAGALENLGRVGGNGTLVEMHDGDTVLIIKVERADGA